MKQKLFILFLLFLSFSCKEHTTEPDTTPPVISILYPVNNAEIKQGTYVTIKVDVSDKGGIKKVVFLIDGEEVYEAIEEPYQYRWDTYKTVGKHTIKAKAYDKSGNMGESKVITVNIKPSDPYEPNDTRATAYQITFTNNEWSSVDGAEVLPETDQDWFKFELNAYEKIKVVIYSQFSSKIVLYHEGTEVAARDNYGNDTLTYTVPFGEEGNYYVGVGSLYNIEKTSGTKDRTGSYRLYIKKSTSDDPYEPNDTRDLAYLITFRDNWWYMRNDAQIYPENDLDWFKFEASEQEEIEIIYRKKSDLHPKMVLYYNENLVSLRYIGSRENDTLKYIAPNGAGGMYYLGIGYENNISKISSVRDSRIGKYWIAIKKHQNNDPYEPNNDRSTAFAINFKYNSWETKDVWEANEGTAISTKNDEDWFMFEAIPGERIVATAALTRGRGYMVLYHNGEQVAKKERIESYREGVLKYFVDADKGGVYYLGIGNGKIIGVDYDYYTFDYSLKIEKEKNLYIYEPNDQTIWTAGDNNVSIKWLTSGFASDVKLELWKYYWSSGEKVMDITTHTANDGEFEWDVPETIEPRKDYFVKILLTSNNNIYDNSSHFTINGSGTIVVKEPNGSTQWEAGQSTQIKWSTGGLGGNVKIELFKGGYKKGIIKESTYNNGTYSYFVSDTLPAGMDYQVKITSKEHNDKYGFSENFEVIGFPTSDPYEPNNDQQHATQITFANNEWNSNTGTEIAPSNDIDWYKFNANYLEIIHIECKVENNKKIPIRLYFNDNLLAESKYGYITYVITEKESGVYYLSVEGVYSRMYNYSLKITKEISTDPYEPNNDITSAYQISFTDNKWIGNSGMEINPYKDQDWFKFHANDREKITITCDVTSNLDAEIVLYYNGKRVAKANIGNNGEDEELFYTVLTGNSGTYYVGIGNYYYILKTDDMQDYTGSYQLKIQKELLPPITMIYVQGGTFDMGSASCGNNAIPVHPVTVNSFYIGKYEVTNIQVAEVFNWALAQGKIAIVGDFVKNTNGTNQSLLILSQIRYNGSQLYVVDNYDNYPVIDISWYGAAAFCNYLSEMEGLTPVYDLNKWTADWNANGYRLPTEAEWEYAARDGNQSQGYKYSGSDNVDEVAWYSGNSGSHTHEVGTKQPNELGLYDMSGNVWEWCWDWYASDYYSYSPQDNPRGPDSGSYRVMRGGSWFDDALYVRVAHRWSDPPSSMGHDLRGFRLLRRP